MLLRKSITAVLVFALYSCSIPKMILLPPSITVIPSKQTALTEEELKSWQHKDIFLDTIPGISVDRAYRELVRNKNRQTVIVAVLDTEIDIEHEDLRDNIWINPGEVPDNGIDDDQNGYIDDIHGWNFLGDIRYTNYETVRILRKYKEKLDENFKRDSLSKGQRGFLEYQNVKNVYKSQIEEAKGDLKYANYLIETYPKSKEALKEFFPKENYSVSQLDSLAKLKEGDEELNELIVYMSRFMKYVQSPKRMYDYKKETNSVLDTILNFEYNEDEIIGDNSEDITDINYGNNNISGKSEAVYHGTLVSGILAASRDNDIGINGISDNIKLMPIRTSAAGDERDKDIALAIRYAVDNGARVINMSFSKQFSMHKEWIFDAIRYAAKKNVLIVTSAGNLSVDLDKSGNYYPNDNNNNEEVADNFMVVGASTPFLNEKFVAFYSNYGKNNVDIFAPGHQIYTTAPNNTYKTDYGTSLATPIVSGVAALIRSHYPNLSASQVKKVILESGTSYNIICNIPGTKGKEKQPFSEFSKSGKVINAYNALLMADKISKN